MALKTTMQISLKIGILSDSHGWIHPAIVNLMNSCDYIIHAGDVIDAQTLDAFTQPLIAVRGNNDEHIPIKELATLSLLGGKIVIQHGHQHGWESPSHKSLRQSYPDAKVIVYGHTHKQVIDTNTNPWIINPGASGKVRNGGKSRCVVLNIQNSQNWVFMPYAFS